MLCYAVLCHAVPRECHAHSYEHAWHTGARGARARTHARTHTKRASEETSIIGGQVYNNCKWWTGFLPAHANTFLDFPPVFNLHQCTYDCSSRTKIYFRYKHSPESPYTLNMEATVGRSLAKTRLRRVRNTPNIRLLAHVHTPKKPVNN